MFTAYSLSKLQTCLFLLSKNSKHPLSKDFFFFGLSCLSLFFRHALRSPTNELNAEETWKRLDEARLFEQRGDDIVPYDYTHLYQQKQENGQAGSAAASHSWVHNQWVDLTRVPPFTRATSEWWSLRQGGLPLPSLSLFRVSKVSVNLTLAAGLFRCGSSGQVVVVTQNMFKVLRDHMFAHWGAEQRIGLDSTTFTQVEQWILQALLAWVHARWAQ